MKKVVTKKLYGDKWVELREMEMDIPKKNIKGKYTYLHETRCDGKIVAVLPFRTKPRNPKEKVQDYFLMKGTEIQFYLRSEFTPPWGVDANFVSSVTGGVDKGDSIIKTVLKETEEETGYTVTEDRVINLGECKGTKSVDTNYYLFGVDLTGLEKGREEPEYLELQAHMFWDTNIDLAVDPLLYVLHYRLMKELK